MKRTAGLVMMFLILLTGSETRASESAGGVYPNGITDFAVGMLPPPGTYLLASAGHYTADKFVNPAPLFSDIDFTITSDSVRVVHMTRVKLPGGGRYGFYGIAAFLDMDLRAGAFRQHASGLADLVVAPVLAGWDHKTIHYGGGLDINLPTGAYDKHRFLNPGRHYTAFSPFGVFTWLSKSGPEFSTRVMYDINTKNTSTGYRTGNELHADFVAAWHFGKSLAVGAGGYVYEQVQPDTGTGTTFGEFKGSVRSIGPYVSWKFKTFSLTGKYSKESGAKNRSEGDRVYVKATIAF